MAGFSTTDLWAYAGGILLTISLIPELEHVWRNQNTSDISYKWLMLYISGLAFTMVYLIVLDAFAGWITILFELVLAVVLLFTKIYIENFSTKAIKEKSSLFYGEDASKSFRYLELLPTSLRKIVISESKATENKDNAYAPGEYRGFHVFLDYTKIFSNDSEDLAGFVLGAITQALRDHDICIVHEKACIFKEEDKTSPPGFASVVLIDESHVSAHSYSELGMLAVDVFTCGSRPDVTKKVADQIHQAIIVRFPGTKFNMSHAKRFPTSLGVEESEQFGVTTRHISLANEV